jgi:hypothetical protein
VAPMSHLPGADGLSDTARSRELPLGKYAIFSFLSTRPPEHHSH